MLIRTAHAGDAAAIAAIYAPHVSEGTASYESVPPDGGEMALRMAAIQAQGFPYLVAESGATILGYAYGSAFRTRPGYRFTVENSIYVAPQAQGAGVGRALLKALIDQCTRAGFRRMVAVIGDGSNEGSVGLHRALGFELAGTVPGLGVKHARWLDWVLMVRPLGDPDAPPPGSDEHPGLPPAL
ncbi:GNAT family N-acetyltransferase [Niveispirillum sp.]|uniref:GNAT family N-acetyltransferase n=1 Tax=Niveispirillum sp. TaxID=1917217 RepID=UPI001B762955|nr:GNAT family N-acetyltransferase [Niveispirillum sp.]MBP7340418.1 N-acetyltransferase [Niveispirillum sp.]